MDEGLDLFDGCHQTGNLGASIVDISAEGGKGFIAGVLVAFEH